jgi:hypothetical protein
MSESTLEEVNSSEFKAFSSPIKVNYKATISGIGKSFTINGVIKTNSENDLFISGYSFVYGVEFFKLVLSEDSIVFVDKIKKEYFNGSLENFDRINHLPVNGDILLNLLFGKNCFTDENYFLDSISSNIEHLIMYYKLLNTLSEIKGEVAFNKKKSILYQSISKSNIVITVNYNKFYKKSLLPKDLKISFSFQDVFFDIDLKYLEFDTLKNESFYIKIPESYSVIK